VPADSMLFERPDLTRRKMVSNSMSIARLRSDRSVQLEHTISPRIGQSLDSFSPTLTLQNARFFQGLTSSEQDVVLEAAHCREYVANSVIAEQGSAANRIFMLLKGSARYFFITPEGRKVNLFWLTPGDIFGGASLLTQPTSFLVSTEAIKNSSVVIWKRDTIRTLAERFPRLWENGLSIACDYLVWYLATHLSLTCDNAQERLAHVLSSLSRGIGKKGRGGEISLEITNEQLANTANLTPFTVSRLLNRWQRDRSITKSRGKIVLLRPDQLFQSTRQQNR
jgi:CRP-like cAMP-binding protein